MVSWTQARSHLARAVQTGQPADVITELRREYTAARLAHLIRSAASELTPEQRRELAGVLAGSPPMLPGNAKGQPDAPSDTPGREVPR